MKFEIDTAMVDKIIVDTLKQDYISQQNDIDRLLSKGELRDFEREDLWMHRETAEGIAIVLRYYMYRPDADAFIAEHTV